MKKKAPEISKCAACGGHFQRHKLTRWTWCDLLVKDKDITVLGIRVAQCQCALHPIVPNGDSLIEQASEIAQDVQVWRWRAKAWELRNSAWRKPEKAQVRAVTCIRDRMLEDDSLSCSGDTWRSLSQEHGPALEL